MVTAAILHQDSVQQLLQMFPAEQSIITRHNRWFLVQRAMLDPIVRKRLISLKTTTVLSEVDAVIENGNFQQDCLVHHGHVQPELLSSSKKSQPVPVPLVQSNGPAPIPPLQIKQGTVAALPNAPLRALSQSEHSFDSRAFLSSQETELDYKDDVKPANLQEWSITVCPHSVNLQLDSNAIPSKL
jgi:hypothetical protein